MSELSSNKCWIHTRFVIAYWYCISVRRTRKFTFNWICLVPKICPQQDWNGFLGWNISISVRTHANDFKEKSLRNARKKILGMNGVFWGRVGLSGLICFLALGFLMLGRNNNTSTAKKTKLKEEKGRGKGCSSYVILLWAMEILNYLIQSTPDNSNLQGKHKTVRVIEGKITLKNNWRELKIASS